MRHSPSDPWTETTTRLDRRSVDVFVPPRAFGDRKGMDAHYPSMFVEDVQNHVFSLGGELRKSHAPVATLEVDCADESFIERMATFAFATHYAYDSRHFAAAFVEWARDCVYWLLRNGCARYELALIGKKPDNPVGFRVVTIYSGRVVRRFGLWGEYVQRLPANARVRNYDSEPEVQPSRIPSIRLGGKSRIFVIVPDKAAAPFREAARELAAIGGETIPEFMIPRDVTESDRVPYDFESFRRTEARAVASATKRVGWYGRGSFTDYQTEYYSLTRRLQFERALLGFRDFLFLTANRLLSQAGEALGFRARVTPNALPTLGELDEMSASLARGDVSASELFDRLFLYA